MAIGDIRPQEIQATTEEDPQVAAALEPADVESRAVPRSNKEQQLTTVQFEDKTYNPSLSKKQMKLKWKVNSRPISSATTKSSPKH